MGCMRVAFEGWSIFLHFSEWERNDWKRKLYLKRERYRYWNGNEEGSAGYYSANYRLCGHHDWVCYCCWNCCIVMLKLIAFTHIFSTFRYIFLGAVLFKAWEGWDYLDGSYFCFISLSSIGFGDLVPGAAVS